MRTKYQAQWRELASRDLPQILASRKGMTLIEVMVVIVIILTLTGVLAFGIFKSLGDAQSDTTRLQMARVAQQVEIHILRKGLPSNGEGFAAVFGDDIPKDSWGNEIQYVTPGPNGMKFDLISLGADGQQGGTGSNEDIRYSDSK